MECTTREGFEKSDSIQLGVECGFIGAYTDSYWNTETSSVSVSAGGVGYTTAAMTWPYSQELYQGWEFGGTWRHDVKYSNSGYPYLRDFDQQRARRSGLPVWLFID